LDGQNGDCRQQHRPPECSSKGHRRETVQGGLNGQDFPMPPNSLQQGAVKAEWVGREHGSAGQKKVLGSIMEFVCIAQEFKNELVILRPVQTMNRPRTNLMAAWVAASGSLRLPNPSAAPANIATTLMRVPVTPLIKADCVGCRNLRLRTVCGHGPA